MSVELTITPGPRSGKGGSSTPPNGGVGRIDPIQVIGLVPMNDCTAEECRSDWELCCYVNTVFGYDVEGEAIPGANYENDVNSFLASFPLSVPNPSATITWTLEKCTGVSTWTSVATLNNNTLGTYSALNTITGHLMYSGFQINWGKVLDAHGVGRYRIKAVSSYGAIPSACLVSEPFQLLAWDCDRAHGTVKFEAWMTGKIGDVNNDGKIFDLCGMNWYDSIRLPGFFGYEKTSEYLEVIQEYQTGLIARIHDEAVQSFEFISGMCPKTLHDRLKVYGLMADTLKVSDYNRNNSDYNIIQKLVVKDGSYDPEYFDKQRRRLSRVKVQFKEGIQNVIKSNCCDTAVG